MKTIVFIDAAQLRPSVVANKLSTNSKLDWVAFYNWMAGIADEASGRGDQSGIFDVHYFDSITEDMSKESYHNFLRQLGFQLHLTELAERTKTCPHCDRQFTDVRQEGVDVGLAVSMMKLAYSNSYDQAILCSGDGVFYELIHFLRKSLGKRVIVLGWSGSVASCLRECAYKSIFLNDHQDEFMKR